MTSSGPGLTSRLLWCAAALFVLLWWLAAPLESVHIGAAPESGDDPVGFQSQPPPGFEALFNGKDLRGWKGLVGDPLKRAAMSREELAVEQRNSDAEIARHWRAEDGEIINDGQGPHLCTIEDYGDFELLLDWKISAGADSGIYLRGSPQVQIWDTVGGIDQAKVGSGALYNNQKNPSKPPVVADKPAGEWNHFRIGMVGERVTVFLNDVCTVDDVVMENYWQRDRPIDRRGQIELQTHGGEIRFRNLFLRRITAEESNELLRARDEEGFVPLFDGKTMEGWQGATDGYEAGDGVLRCKRGHGGNLLTRREFGDFVLRFEFRLEPGSNNGLAIRAPADGNPAYDGMELQILEDSHDKYRDLKPWQFHGSVYGIQPAHRGYQHPVGEWNFEEVVCKGSRVQVILNGTTITDVDLSAVASPIDGEEHPGMRRTHGHIGFMGHHDPVELRRIMIREL